MSGRIYRTRIFLASDGGELPKVQAKKARIKALDTNAGYVWYNILDDAVENECVPLEIGEKSDELFIDRVSDIKLAFENSADKAVIIYERFEVDDRKKGT